MCGLDRHLLHADAGPATGGTLLWQSTVSAGCDAIGVHVARQFDRTAIGQIADHPIVGDIKVTAVGARSLTTLRTVSTGRQSLPVIRSLEIAGA